MIKAITFDCWDTLLDDDESRENKRREHFRFTLNENAFLVTQDEIDELFLKEAELFKNYIIENKKTRSSRERIETILLLANAQIPESEVDKLAIFCDRIALELLPPVVPGSKDALEILSQHYKLGLICNTGWHSAQTVRQILEENDLPKYFSHLTFSDEVGVAKPHKQIFEYTLEKLGSRTEEAVHIGDSEYSDIVGAKQANMKAILFAGVNEKYKNNNSADLMISTYENLAEIIEQL